MTDEPEVKQEVVLNQDNTNHPTANIEKKTDAPNEDPNWKAFREARKKDRLQREQAEHRAAEKEAEVAALKAAMEAAFARDNKKPIHQQQYDQEETEDDRIEKKVQAALAIREQQAAIEREKREQQEYPKRLMQTYPDFNDVVSTENLDYLEYHYPEISGPLKRLPDNFDKWSDAYRAIKKFLPNSTSYKKEIAKADSNFSKPKSMSSSGFTQAGEGMGNARLTEDRKASNWERMQRTLKGLS